MIDRGIGRNILAPRAGRTTVAKRFHGRKCCYCPQIMDKDNPDLSPTRDHYPIPKCKGGTRTLIACNRCNVVKGDLSADAWQTFMLHNPTWWQMTLGELRPIRYEHRVEREAARRSPEKPTFAIGDQLMALGLGRRIAEDFDKVFPRAETTDSGDSSEGA